MSQKGHVPSKVGTNHQHGIEFINGADLDAQDRKHRLGILHPEIPLPQAVVNAAGANMPQQTRREALSTLLGTDRPRAPSPSEHP